MKGTLSLNMNNKRTYSHRGTFKTKKKIQKQLKKENKIKYGQLQDNKQYLPKIPMNIFYKSLPYSGHFWSWWYSSLGAQKMSPKNLSDPLSKSFFLSNN